MVFRTTTFAIVLLLAGVSVDAQPQVPCTFFFGDSQFDNGNNNVLLTTLAKVNYRPYGIDYPTGPSGRFANGPNVPDYLVVLMALPIHSAQMLGYADPIPPYVNAIRNSNVLNGVNYASGGAGILDETGLQLGGRFTMNQQLSNHGNVINRIASIRRRSVSSIKNDYLTQCLYVVNIGNNDYLNNYLLPLSPTSSLYNPDRFAQLLIQRLSQQLTNLYNDGARKVAVFGAGQLGCIPQTIAALRTSGCVDSINNIVRQFNDRMKALIDALNNQLNGARLTYINITSITSGDPSTLGIKVATTPCCTVSAITCLCIPNSVPCSNRNEYTFWDNFHLSSSLNKAVATRAYSAVLPSDASPVDIQHLVQQ